MTMLNPTEVVRCSECSGLAVRQTAATIDLAPRFDFEKVKMSHFAAMSRGDVTCPHCETNLNDKEIKILVRLDQPWKKWVWYGIPYLISNI